MRQKRLEISTLVTLFKVTCEETHEYSSKKIIMEESYRLKRIKETPPFRMVNLLSNLIQKSIAPC